MPKITIRNKTVDSDGPDPYVIAEIGCNHDGSIDKALEMIDVAASCGVDAVKFQKRTPEKLFTAEALAAPYDSPNAHGATYGDHRRALDWFGLREFMRISERCFNNDVAFICTPFTMADVDFLAEPALELDAFKVASCDLTNTPMIGHIVSKGLPVIVSTGGGDHDAILQAMKLLPPDYAALMHCVSTYPNNDDDLCLSKIGGITTGRPLVTGFSSHHPGLLPHYIAYMQGARIFEAHFTLNRGGRGTDHGFSLEPAGLRQLCEDLKRIPRMIGHPNRKISEKEKNGFVKKMGKSIYVTRKMFSGEIIGQADVELRAPADGLPAYLMPAVIGCSVTRSIPAGGALHAGDIAERID